MVGWYPGGFIFLRLALLAILSWPRSALKTGIGKCGTISFEPLLEHSTPQLTNDVYTNVDPVLRQAISQLPVAEWV